MTTEGFAHLPVGGLYWNSNSLNSDRAFKSRVTVSYKLVESPRPEVPGLLAVALAFTAPNDNFCRAKGRQIAHGRLETYLLGEKMCPHVHLINIENDEHPVEAIRRSQADNCFMLPARWRSMYFL